MTTLTGPNAETEATATAESAAAQTTTVAGAQTAVDRGRLERSKLEFVNR